jgi:hypothetical protein
MRNRAIMTGGYMRPSWFNKPLPRLSPQPIHITMMIASRRKARASRTMRFEQYSEWKEDMKHEARFERLLQEQLLPEQAQQFQMVFQDREWGTSKFSVFLWLPLYLYGPPLIIITSLRSYEHRWLLTHTATFIWTRRRACSFSFLARDD